MTTSSFYSQLAVSKPAIRSFHHIDISTAAEQCLSSIKWDERRDFDLQRCMPPFDQCVFTYRAGGNGVLLAEEEGGPAVDKDFATVLMRSNITPEDIKTYREYPLTLAGHSLTFVSNVNLTHGNWSSYMVSVFLDSDGFLLREPGGFPFAVASDCVDTRTLTGLIGTTVLPVLFACSLLNIRNVSLEAVPLPPLPHNKERARMERRRRYQSGQTEHHTIVIRHKGQVVRSLAAQLDSLGAGYRRLAFTRGHFRHYVPERPLLGRAGLFGAFWIPAFLSGSVENGIITADYKMELAA